MRATGDANRRRQATPARKLALEALSDVGAQGAYSTLALDKRLREARLSNEDRRLATALFYGVLEKKLALNYILGNFMEKPCDDSLTQENLRMAAYQIFYMEVPDYAACGEAVALSRALGREALCPLVNAVCRRMAANKESFRWPEDPLERLSLDSSTPRWLLDRLIADLGAQEAEDFLTYSAQDHATAIQVNTLKMDAQQLAKRLADQGFAVEKGLVPGALRVRGGGLMETDAFRNGLFFAQGEASALAALALGLKGGMQVLDACAAPGGKSFTAAMAMKGSGRVHAMDIHPHRVKLIETGAQRLGLDNIRPRIGDARNPVPTLEGMLDAVLVDAPCSGLGILGKPDIRHRLTEQELSDLPAMQRAILDNCAALVKPGGALVYSTCTVLSAENRQVVDGFLQGHPDFSLKGLEKVLPEPFSGRVDEGVLSLMPHRDGTDGFFIARMVKAR